MEDGVELFFLHDASNQRNLVSVIQDCKVIFEPDMFWPASEYSGTETVKRTDSNPLASEQSFYSSSHFPSSFVGEGQREDLIRVNSTLQQTHDAVRDDTSFPGARPRENKQRSFEMFNCLMLGVRKADSHCGGVERQNKTPRSCGKAIE